MLASLPVAFVLVYGMFKPIRQLVDATRKMAAGRNDFALDTDRRDQIGELSRSFTDMAGRVRRQREALHSSNVQLGEANGRLNNANAALANLNEALNTANAKLSEANRDLERKVADRTAQLEAANRRLSGEISEKEDFLRAVSHDLNAPLRNIAGMASMLVTKHKDKFDADILHRLDRIQKNVQVETDLIGELLELSRIKTRRGEAERVDVSALVMDIGGVFEQDLQTKGISLVVDGPMPQLTAERARVRQVFQNLIDNAIKYMGERPGRGEGDPRRLRAGRRRGRVLRPRHRRGHRGRRPGQGVPRLPPGPQRGRVQRPRQGRGAGQREGDRRDVQRLDLGRERRRPGQHVPVHGQRAVRGGEGPAGRPQGRLTHPQTEFPDNRPASDARQRGVWAPGAGQPLSVVHEAYG